MSWPTEVTELTHLNTSDDVPVAARPNLKDAADTVNQIVASRNVTDGVMGTGANGRLSADYACLPKRAVATVSLAVNQRGQAPLPFASAYDQDNTGFFNFSNSPYIIYIPNTQPNVSAIQIDLYLAVVMLSSPPIQGSYVTIQLFRNGERHNSGFAHDAIVFLPDTGGYSLHYRSPYLNYVGAVGTNVVPFQGNDAYSFKYFYGNQVGGNDSLTLNGFCSVTTIM